MSFLSDIEKEEEIFIKDFKTMTSKDISLDTKELEKYFHSLTDEEKKNMKKKKLIILFF